jgi:hypothetical protein
MQAAGNYNSQTAITHTSGPSRDNHGFPSLGYRTEVVPQPQQLLSTRLYATLSSLLYDWLFTPDQLFLASSPIKLTPRNFID